MIHKLAEIREPSIQGVVSIEHRQKPYRGYYIVVADLPFFIGREQSEVIGLIEDRLCCPGAILHIINRSRSRGDFIMSHFEIKEDTFIVSTGDFWYHKDAELYRKHFTSHE